MTQGISDIISETTHAVRGACRDYIREHCSEELLEPLLYALGSKAACDRSLVTRLAYEALGGEWRDILLAMVGAELMDFAVIAIDDILDNAPRRMTKPSHPAQFGESVTICVASVLKSLGTLALIDCLDSREAGPSVMSAALRAFENDHVGIYTGQYRDVSYETTDVEHVGTAECLDMMRLTTGVQIGCMAALGAILAGAPQPQVESLQTFGTEVGVIFQIRDDFIDFLDDEKATGKTPFLDWTDGKKRYPLLLALEVLPVADARRLVALLGKGELTPAEKGSIMRSISSDAVRSAALHEVGQRRRMALGELKRLEVADVATQALRELLGIGCRL